MKKYFEEKIAKVDEVNRLRFDSIVTSTQLAKELMETRLKGMDEVKENLKDANNTYLTRNEFNIQHDKLNDDIRILRESKANLEGKASMSSVYLAYIIAGLSLMISIIKFFI